MFGSKGYGIFSDHSFSSRGVCSHEDRISQFEMIDGLLLEWVEFEGILQAFQFQQGTLMS
jgi:hypothetical protein